MSVFRPTTLVLGAVVLLAVSGCGPTSSPHAKSTASTTPKPRSVSLDITKLSTGPAPKIGWRHGREIHLGHRTVTVDSDIDAFVVTRKRLITETYRDAGTSVDVRDDNGRSSASYPIGSGHPVENAARNIVAWVDDNVTPKVLQDGVDKPLTLAKPDGASGGEDSYGEAVGVLGHDCLHDSETVEGAGCSVFFNWYHDSHSSALVSSNHGFTDQAGAQGIRQIFDVSRNQALIGNNGVSANNPVNRYDRDGTGYAVKGYLPMSFSPNGAKILALPAQLREGPATDSVSVLDAKTGRALVTGRSPRDFVTLWESQWEDNTHLLCVVQQGEGRWAIVRLGLDGKAELAVPPIRDARGAPALSLAIQP